MLVVLLACWGPSAGRVEAERQSARWFEVAWGQPPDAEQLARTKRRLDCLERELEGRDVDVSSELSCFAKRMAIGSECQEQNPKAIEVCLKRASSACLASLAFVEASAACPDDAP